MYQLYQKTIRTGDFPVAKQARENVKNGFELN